MLTRSQNLIISVILLSALFAGYIYWSNNNESTELLEYVKPEEVGWSTEKLDLIKPLVEESGYSAIMVAYDGKIFYSYGDVSKNYNLHSIRNPLESAIYGIHVDRGEIDLDETAARAAEDRGNTVCILSGGSIDPETVADIITTT